MSTQNELLSNLETLAEGLIRDRTEEDAASLVSLRKKRYSDMTSEEKVLINSSMKGGYNATDLNRVAVFCNTFAEFSASLDYIIPSYTPIRTNWSENESITRVDLNSYIDAIKKIQNKWSFGARFDIPESIANGLTVSQANAIEEMLYKAYKNARSILINMPFSGLVYSGLLWDDFASERE